MTIWQFVCLLMVVADSLCAYFRDYACDVRRSLNKAIREVLLSFLGADVLTPSIRVLSVFLHGLN